MNLITRKNNASEVKANPQSFFTYQRAKKKTKSNTGPLLDENGALTQDNKQMAGVLNKSFASVFTLENAEVVPGTPSPLEGIEPLETGILQEQEVQMYLDKLDAIKSTEPYNISPRQLQEPKQQIVRPVTSILNRSIQINKVPKDWKLANVTPIKKKKRR